MGDLLGRLLFLHDFDMVFFGQVAERLDIGQVLVFHQDYHAIFTPYLWGWLASLVVAVAHFATGKWKTKAVVQRDPEAVIE